MTPEEARLAITDTIVQVLVDLGTDDPDLSDQDLLDIEESMGDVAAMLLEAFDLKVLAVDGDKLSVEMTLPPLVS